MIVYYLTKVRETDMQTRRYPLHCEVPGIYESMYEAEAEAERRNARNDGYLYEVEMEHRYE